MQEFANRIIAELENGVKPWLRPWDPEKAGGPQAPFNPVTGKGYHGINVLILGIDLRAFQSGDPRWMTYQQAQGKDWQVRKGERSTTIFFTKPYEVEDEDKDDGRKIIRVLKHYAVFHASQIDGVPAYKAPAVEEAPWTRPEASEIILKTARPSFGLAAIGRFIHRQPITSSFHQIMLLTDRRNSRPRRCMNSRTGRVIPHG
jgi:antirestriction protein ArdC